MYSVTKQFTDWLNGLGYSAHAHPPKSGTEYVTVERTGGSVSNKVDYPTIAVQTWAQTPTRAEQMALEIRNHALLSTLPDGVHQISVNAGPYPYWDENTRSPRYQIVFDVVCILID